MAFVDVGQLRETNAKRCAQILSNKLGCGQKVFCVDVCKTILWGNSCVEQIIDCMENPLGSNEKCMFTIYYNSISLTDVNRNQTDFYHLYIDKRNSVANTDEFVDILNGGSLMEAKQHLGSFLALAEAAALPGGGGKTTCGNCGAVQHSSDVGMMLVINEPRWSDCAGCELK